MTAPNVSPKKEISVPFQKPKNKILAPVINTLGTTPNIATTILMIKLESKASCACC